MTANGITSTIIKILIGGTITIFVTILSFMGKGIVDNDVRNSNEHTTIRKEIVEATTKNANKIEAVKDIVTDIRIEQREMVTILKGLAK